MKVAKNRGFYKSCYAGWPTKIYQVMRLTALFLFAACLEVQAHGYSQGKLTLAEKDAPLPKIFQAIERQSDYHFFYDYPLLQGAGRVDVKVKNASLDDVLKICFKGQGFTYSVVGKMVTVVENKETGAPVPGNGVPGVIAEFKGRVTNESGEPLQGATVEVQGAKAGTFTDEKGVFTFKNIPSDAVFEISFTGYQKTVVKLLGTTSLSVVLKVATNQLDQVQIIAYGTTTQRLNTGNVSSVSSEEIADQPVANPIAAMEGRVPGMFITQNTGMPGGSFTIQIRGQNSITNGNDPLYVIDGVPYISELLPSENPGGGSPFNFLNTADIERIDVLKDADATAIYGSRGANGVVLITTKRGKAGKTSVNMNIYSGMARVPHYMDLMNTQQYLEMRHEALNNDGVQPSLSNGDYDLLQWDTARYTNWQKQLIGGTGHYYDAQGSISGGSANTQYLIGGGYHKETTVFPSLFSDQKGSFHISVSTTSSDQRFKVLFSANYVADNNHLPLYDLTEKVSTTAPDSPPIYNPDGTLNWANSTSGSATWTNPYAGLSYLYLAQTNNLIGNAVLSYEIMRGLSLKTSIGYTNMQVNETSTNPIAAQDPIYTGTTGTSYFTTNSVKSWIAEPQLSYKVQLGRGDLSALVGATFEQNTSTGSILQGQGYTSDALIEDIQAAPAISSILLTSAVYKYNAGYGRLNYNWQNKYLINITGRRDGSSRFGPASQFANFGAVGAGWIFSKEKFIENSFPALSFGKFRGSFGTTGNDQIGDYRFLDLYSIGPNPYANTVGLTPSNLFNQNLAWEINKKLEGGLELGFIKDRILFTVSYFRNRSSNQLVSAPLPSITGFTSISENLPALVQNRGLEYTFNTTNIKTRNFEWNTSFNLTMHQNKLLAFPNLASSSYSNQLAIGHPLSVHKVFHYAGVNDTTGIYQFTGSKGSITYSPIYGTDNNTYVDADPKFYGGLMNRFRYKGFQLDVFFQFVKQKGINYLYGLNNSIPPGFEGYNQLKANLKRWQKPGDQTNIGRFTETYSNAYNGFINVENPLSDVSFTDASYLRLKNLSVSYNLPKDYVKKMHIEGCKIYIQCQNLFTLTNHYLGLDPETQSVTSLPVLRVLTGGIQLAF